MTKKNDCIEVEKSQLMRIMQRITLKQKRQIPQ